MRTTGRIATVASIPQARHCFRGLCLSGMMLVLIGVTPPLALATGDVNRTDCHEFPGTEESSGFHASLPDCRAYEMVTPPYKAGQPAFGPTHRPPPISPDGERLLAIDFAGFAGIGNLENKSFEVGAIYSFSRGATGWTTEALEPSAEEAARSEYVTASVDLKSSLWQLVNQAVTGEEPLEQGALGYSLALRSAAPDPAFVPIGRLTPPGSPNGSRSVAFVGASSSLSHILFKTTAVTGDLWPGDTTEEFAPSLYEYDGTGNVEPMLVGVRNEGRLAGTEVNEHADLISQCGTRLGSSDTTYNAISGSGERVYFSAVECPEGGIGTGPEVTELYTRTSQSQTMPISEPTTAQCAACNVPATRDLGRAPASFEGASLDGSKAFFLSEQDLLPPIPTGAKGESLYEDDWNRPPGSQVVLIASEVLAVVRVSEDGSHIYFVATPVLPSSPDASLPIGQDTPTAGSPNLYSYDTSTGETAFVATLSVEDEALSARADRNRPADVTPDGRFLLFRSAASLTAGNTGTVAQLFEYDADTEELVRVSRGQVSAEFPNGFGDNGNATDAQETPLLLKTPQYAANMQPDSPRTGVALAVTGAVAFTSHDALAPGAVKGRENVYEYREGNVFLISPGDELAPLATEESRLLGISESGRDVFFFTADTLLPQDADTQADWYDAREGGGFPPSLGVPECGGEACREPFAALPALPLPAGSQTTPGGDNLSPPSEKSEASKPKPLTRAQKLANALKACRKVARKRRAACERSARSRYGNKKAKGKKSTRKQAAVNHNKKGR